MPISIAGSGTITGISVGGIPDGVVDTDVLAANAVTTAKLGSAEASGLAKAWVNFNGTGAVAIRASYNVSSITDNGTGDYTVNFTTAFADANYARSVGSGGKSHILIGAMGRCKYKLAECSVQELEHLFDHKPLRQATVYVAIFR
jgi:hypothetical protein